MQFGINGTRAEHATINTLLPVHTSPLPHLPF